MPSFFVTGTDTEIGKTTVAVALTELLNAAGYSTFAMKPVASGSEWDGTQWVNDDALALAHAASIKCDYAVTNPFIFRDPIAPHLAAGAEGQSLSQQTLVRVIRETLLNSTADFNIVEGVGGWLVPLNNQELMADVVGELQLPVVLVVGMRLGCLNHALLTYRSIIAMGLPVIGWIANCIDPAMAKCAENIATLQALLACPYLGCLPYGGDRAQLDISRISLIN